jgi:hypothetical protein
MCQIRLALLSRPFWHLAQSSGACVQSLGVYTVRVVVSLLVAPILLAVLNVLQGDDGHCWGILPASEKFSPRTRPEENTS